MNQTLPYWHPCPCGWKPPKGTAAMDARIARQYTAIEAMGILAFPGAV